MPRRSLYSLCALALAAGCAAAGGAFDASCPEVDRAPATQDEMSYLTSLQAHHHAADRFEAEALPDRAEAEMTAALAIPRPEGAASEEAYLDTAGRAAQ